MSIQIQAFELCNDNAKIPSTLKEKLDEDSIKYLIEWCEKHHRDISKASLKCPEEEDTKDLMKILGEDFLNILLMSNGRSRSCEIVS
jgi:hypothetical protein